MARISQPSNAIIAMYDKEMGINFEDGSVFHDIYRAYQRVNGKFEPIGWSVQAFNIQRSDFEIRVYTDQQIRQFELGQIS